MTVEIKRLSNLEFCSKQVKIVLRDTTTKIQMEYKQKICLQSRQVVNYQKLEQAFKRCKRLWDNNLSQWNQQKNLYFKRKTASTFLKWLAKLKPRLRTQRCRCLICRHRLIERISKSKEPKTLRSNQLSLSLR